MNVKNSLLLGPAALLPLLLTACSSVYGTMPAGGGNPRDSLSARVSRLEYQLETRPGGSQGNDDLLRQINRQQADFRAELDSLRVDLQSLTGQLADQQQQQQRLFDQLNLRLNDLELRTTSPEQPPVTATPPVATAGVAALPQSASLPLAAASEATVSTTPASAPSSETALPGEPHEAQQLYDQALQQVQQQQDFTAARQLFETFVSRFPNHSLVVNAQYWIGETYYGDKKYENAILQFQDVISLFPQHPKVPAALLKQGLAFHALGDVRNARIILEKVVASYPDSGEADKARQRLANWQ